MTSLALREALESGQLSLVNPEVAIIDVAKLMGEGGMKEVFVVKGKNPLGLVRETDIVSKVVAQGLDPSQVRAQDIMLTPAPSVDIKAGLREVSRIMVEKRVGRVLVLEKGQILGTISMNEILRSAAHLDDPHLHKALSIKTRTQILELLSLRPWKIDELAEKISLSPITTRHHIEVLIKAGLVEETGAEVHKVGRPSALYSLSLRFFRKDKVALKKG